MNSKRNAPHNILLGIWTGQIARNPLSDELKVEEDVEVLEYGPLRCNSPNNHEIWSI